MRRRYYVGRGRVAVAAAAAAVLVLSGCGDTGTPPPDPLRRDPGRAFLYGTDGNMMNAVGDLLSQWQPGALDGMKGTTPLTPLTQSFRGRLHSVDSSLVDYTYAGETYDAVVISALAAAVAGSTRPRDIAAQINGVTNGGEECDTPAQCLDLIEAGRDIRYRGITLGLGGFSDLGEPSTGLYGILRFGADNRIVQSLTQYVAAGNSATMSQEPPRGSDTNTGGQLKIGALLPHTGELGSAGPPMFAGGQLAVREINEAGGVLGQQVRWLDGDDGTNPDVAKATTQRLINEGAQVIIGAGASSISLAVLPIIKEAGVVLFSPANTSAQLTSTDDGGLYFRTAPPDGLQAAALADIIVRDGVRRLAIVYRDEAYGSGLAMSTRDILLSAGLAEDAITVHPYVGEQMPLDEQGQLDLEKIISDQHFGEIAQAVKTMDPDGILIIGFTETVAIIDALAVAGITSISN